MTPPETERLLSLLLPADAARQKPPRHLYAVLDGARDRGIHRAVAESGRPHCCLYRGELPPDLAEAAPWLVQLDLADEWTRWLLETGWGRSWGVFLDTAVELPYLQRHLRGLLRVLGPDGKPLLFRYYDPRVLRPYLSTTTADEARMVLGPLVRVLMESEDGRALLIDERHGGVLTRRVVPLADEPPHD